MAEQAINDLINGLHPLPDGYKIVAVLEGIYHDELMKKIAVFAPGKYQEHIHINDSKISQPLGNIDFIVEYNMSKVIGSYDPNQILNAKNEAPSTEDDKDKTIPINLKVKCNKRDIQLLKSIKQSDAVAILFNSDQKVYIFTDGNTTIEISRSEYKDLPSPPALSEGIFGEPVSVDPVQMKLFKGKGKTVVLEVFDNQLEKLRFQGGISHSFSVGNTLDLMKKQPERFLESKHFLEIAGKDKVSLTMAKDTDGNYWLISETRLSLNLTARISERLY
jgi:hypothetical protein